MLIGAICQMPIAACQGCLESIFTGWQLSSILSAPCDGLKRLLALLCVKFDTYFRVLKSGINGSR